MNKNYPGRLLLRSLAALFPGRCLHCQLPSRRSLDLCRGCEAELPLLAACCSICAEPLPVTGICGHCLAAPPDFSRVVAPYRYAPPLDSWINRFKRHGDLRSGRVLGELLAGHLHQSLPELARPDCLVPVPLHWRRRFSRGFNQSRELATVVSHRNGIPLRERLVRRVKPTPHQQTLDRRQRQRNLRRAFSATRDCAGLRIAVIDDVVTTTGTARALAAALTTAGALDVQIWALARTALANQPSHLDNGQ